MRPKLFCFIVENFLLKGLQTVQSCISCNLVTLQLVTFYLLCNNLSRVVLFVQTRSVEVLVFPQSSLVTRQLQFTHVSNSHVLLLCKNLSCVALFVQTRSVEGLVFPQIDMLITHSEKCQKSLESLHKLTPRSTECKKTSTSQYSYLHIAKQL